MFRRLMVLQLIGCLSVAVGTRDCCGADPAPLRRGVVVPRGTERLAVLSQHWDDEEAEWFYNVPQGSRLLPYAWFLHLESPQGTDAFRSDANVAEWGYIPRVRSAKNPDGLPVGFVKDAEYEDGTAGLGITCAACHTSVITFDKTAILVDGGPSHGDFARFLGGLAAALKATVENDEKFGRFAAKVLANGANDAARADLKNRLKKELSDRERYNKHNIPDATGVPFGPGRVDAFGAIFNEVAGTFLGIPENYAKADAPVSYPCLWDAPQHDRVQWTGAAENRVSDLGNLLFGTDQVGSLGRNTGEVLGVFGHATVTADKLLVPGRYPSTTNKQNLLDIEESLAGLWSPVWPVDLFGPLDESRRKRGELLYCHHCKDCHAVLKRDDPNRKVVAQMRAVGTDGRLWTNSAREGSTGRLADRIVTLSDPKVRFGARDRIGMILKHVVERAMLVEFNPTKLLKLKGLLAKHALTPSGLTSDYFLTAVIELDGKNVAVPVSGYSAGGEGAAKFELHEGEIALGKLVRAMTQAGILPEGLEGSHRDKLQALLNRPAMKLPALVKGDAAAKAPVAQPVAPPEIAYKARPLNGVWATGPYLHNGSVRTLADLLRPVDNRASKFRAGGREFDPKEVGFKEDANAPELDTSRPGNSNAGHLAGTTLSDQEKLDLLEYLKSL